MVLACKSFPAATCASNSFCQLNFLEQPNGEIGVCTHKQSDSSSQIIVNKCKVLPEQACVFNSACLFNFNEAPKYDIDTCTHLPS
jgi:hypothetical protein